MGWIRKGNEKKEEERRKERRKGRFGLKAKPNPSTHTITTHHDTISPSPPNKSRKSRRERRGDVTDWVSVSEPFLSSIPQRRKHFSWLNGHWLEPK